MEILPTIKKFIQLTKDDNQHRYTSWEICYQAFDSFDDKEFLSLHLAGYLASWGMYRGSSGLLQKNYLIHTGAIDKIEKASILRCTPTREIRPEDIDRLLKLIKELQTYYRSITYVKENGVSKRITATDTLISKIILGTLGCLPALDRYYLIGAQDYFQKQGNKQKINDLKSNSLETLLAFIHNKYEEILLAQQQIRKTRNIYYPVMKICDMFFWQIDYDIETEKKQ